MAAELVGDAEARQALYLIGSSIAYLRRPENVQLARKAGKFRENKPEPPTVGHCKTTYLGVNNSKLNKNYGAHTLCENAYTPPCRHYKSSRACMERACLTYGVEQEYTFELDLARIYGCSVLALDPSVNHNVSLGPGVRFARIGADSPESVAPEFKYKHRWETATPANAARTINPRGALSVLKMDCEGCEVLLYNRTMAADPTFFQRVDQFAVETHVSRRWLPNEAAMLEYGRLLGLLLRSGFLLFHAETAWCLNGEERGLISELITSGYFQREEGHCEMLLFAKAAKYDTPSLRWRPPFPFAAVHPPKKIEGDYNKKTFSNEELKYKLRLPAPSIGAALGPNCAPATLCGKGTQDDVKDVGGGWYEVASPSGKVLHPGPKGEDYTKFYSRQHGMGGTSAFSIQWRPPAHVEQTRFAEFKQQMMGGGGTTDGKSEGGAAGPRATALAALASGTGSGSGSAAPARKEGDKVLGFGCVAKQTAERQRQERPKPNPNTGADSIQEVTAEVVR